MKLLSVSAGARRCPVPLVLAGVPQHLLQQTQQEAASFHFQDSAATSVGHQVNYFQFMCIFSPTLRCQHGNVY